MKPTTTTGINHDDSKTITEPAKYLVCDNPLHGPETYVLHTGKMFIIRMHDMELIEGVATDDQIKEAQDWYVNKYLPFINN